MRGETAMLGGFRFCVKGNHVVERGAGSHVKVTRAAVGEKDGVVAKCARYDARSFSCLVFT